MLLSCLSYYIINRTSKFQFIHPFLQEHMNAILWSIECMHTPNLFINYYCKLTTIEANNAIWLNIHVVGKIHVRKLESNILTSIGIHTQKKFNRRSKSKITNVYKRNFSRKLQHAADNNTYFMLKVVVIF